MASDALFERLEFLVPGVPQSAQKRRASRSKELWMDTVRDRAGQATGPDWNSLTTPLRVQIVHYHRLADALDVDNMLKPINDALKHGVVFSDDHLSRICSARAASCTSDSSWITSAPTWLKRSSPVKTLSTS